MLVVLLQDHEAALRADLQARYQLNIDHVRDQMTLWHLAALVAELPPGSQVWRSTGGPWAWTDEVHMLSSVEWGIRVLAWMKTEDGQKGRNIPERIEPPVKGEEPARLSEQEELAVTERRAQRYIERTQGKG